MINIEHLTVRYGDLVALDDVSLRVADGERVAFVGPNGAGKSTLLRALIGKGTAVVPQDIPAGLALGCRDFVMLGRTARLSPWRAPSAADEAAVDRALEGTGAGDLVGRRMDAVSGGERQRLALALALATGATTLLMDEPTSHLDLRRRAEFFALLATLKSTVLMSLHDLPQASEYFSRVILLARGRILADGAPDAVLTPAPVSAAYGVPVERISRPALRVVV